LSATYDVQNVFKYDPSTYDAQLSVYLFSYEISTKNSTQFNVSIFVLFNINVFYY